MPFGASQSVISLSHIYPLTPLRQLTEEAVPVGGEIVIFTCLNAHRMNSSLYYHSEHVFGVSKTPRAITWGYTAPENRPSDTHTVMQIRRQHDTLVKQTTHSTPVRSTQQSTSKTHNMPHTIARISARTHQSRPGAWAGSTEPASNRIRSRAPERSTIFVVVLVQR